jgi:hypothetical protein
MPQIDIELPAAVRQKLELPRCVDLKLPEPAKLSISLPLGGTLPAVGDFTKGIPDDCSLSFSLLLQLGPFLGAFECLFRTMALVAPLVQVVQGLPTPPFEALQKLGEALPPFLECVAKIAVPAAGIIPELAGALQCAQENAAASAGHVMSALDPIATLLSLMSPFLEIAQVGAIALPSLGSPSSAEAITQVTGVLRPIAETMLAVAQGLGG